MAGKREYCPHCGSKTTAGYAGWWCPKQSCPAARKPLWSWQLVDKPKRAVKKSRRKPVSKRSKR